MLTWRGSGKKRTEIHHCICISDLSNSIFREVVSIFSVFYKTKKKGVSKL